MSKIALDFLDSDLLQTNITKEYLRVKTNLKNVLHSTNFCGICYEKDVTLIHIDILSNIFNIPSDCAFQRLLNELFGDVIVNNIASTFICESCKMEIIQAYTLIAKVKHASRILNSYFKQMANQIDSVEQMLNSTANCDFENTIIVLQDSENDDGDFLKRIVISKLNNNAHSDDYATDKSDDMEIRIKSYTCEYCSKCFTSKALVAAHIKRIHKKEYTNEDKEKCLDCAEAPCPHEKYLDAIKIQRQRHERELQCVDCDYASIKKRDILAHINKEHLKLYPYLCEICGKNFAARNKHRSHMLQYHQQSFNCEYCDVEFKDKATLNSHVEVCKDEERYYKCKNCVASFDTEESLVVHNTSHTNKKVQCHLCSKKVKNSYFLKRHIFYAHNGQAMSIKTDKKSPKKDERARPCSICPLILYSLTDLKAHLTTHKPHEKHKCLACNKQFNTRKHYNIHVSSWTHLKKVNPEIKFNFKCADCDFTCKSKLVMENHKNTVHLQVKPYRCDSCGKTFTTALNLRYHKERHRGVKRFQCSVCSNLFTSTSGLKKHVLRHHSEKRPYACDLCDKTFVNQSERNLHKLRNHAEKAVPCPLCEVKFASMANLRAHTRKVHFKTKDGFDTYMNSELVSQEFYEMFRDHRLKF